MHQDDTTIQAIDKLFDTLKNRDKRIKELVDIVHKQERELRVCAMGVTKLIDHVQDLHKRVSTLENGNEFEDFLKDFETTTKH